MTTKSPSSSDQSFVWQLLAMLATELIDERQFRPWADYVILNETDLPNWVINLSLAHNTTEAVDVLYQHVAAKPPPHIFKSYPRDWIACQWLRYRGGQISWPQFLSIAGTYADRYDCGVPGDDFDRRMNEYLANTSRHMEAIQADWVEGKFHDAIERMQPVYESFVERAATWKQNGAP
jgi:hypothetical protein